MAKATGPLFSLAAQGSIGKKALVFCTSGQRTIVKTWKVDKRGKTEAQAKYYAVVKEANRAWKNLPEYLKEQWNNTSFNTPQSKGNLPFTTEVKGRLLFLRYALHWMQKGFRGYASPYGHEPAPVTYELAPHIYKIT